MWDPFAEFEKVVLANGLSVYIAQWRHVEFEALYILIHSGSLQDVAGYEGTAHFLEHMVNENAPIAHDQIEAFFDDCGGSAGFGRTSPMSTEYYFKVPAEEEMLFRGLSIFGEMLAQKEFAKNLKRARQTTLDEFHLRYPNKLFYGAVAREMRAVLHHTRYQKGMLVLGSPVSIRAINSSVLADYHERHYVPANMSIIAVGASRKSALVSLLEQSPFGRKAEGARQELAQIPPPPVPLESGWVVDMKKYGVKRETAQYISTACVRAGAPQKALELTRWILEKVLSDEVRERRRWTYDVRCHLWYCPVFALLGIRCYSLNLDAIGDIRSVVEQCIAQAGARKDLLERVKRRRIGRMRIMDHAGLDVCEDVAGDVLSRGEIISIADAIREIESVSMAQVRQILEYLAPARRWTLLMVP